MKRRLGVMGPTATRSAAADKMATTAKTSVVSVALLLALAIIATPLPVLSQGGDKESSSRRPTATRQTQAISATVFKDLDEAQKAIDAKDYPVVFAALDRLKARQDKLNDFERATLYNLYAVAHFNQDNVPKAIEAYQEVLKQPNLPEGLRDASLFALAQMYFVTEQYALAVRVLNRWFQLAESPSADAYVLLAQAHYQQQKYAEAEKSLLDALRVARERGVDVRENWLGLLRAVYYELGNYDRAARVLELLVSRFPSESYYLQLSGMYGLLGNQRAQLATLHAAYLAGMLTKEGDLLNLARLYMVEDAPFPAVQLLSRGLRERSIEASADNLQLFAQTLSFAQEYEAQVPVLKRLAELTNDARHHTFHGQALVELGRWDEAIDAFSAALRGNDVIDAAAIRMQLGTAQFNAGKLQDARRSFIAAQDSSKVGQAASNWVRFVSAEIERQEALRGG